MIPQPTFARQLNKLLAIIARQQKRVRQGGYGPVLGSLATSALDVGQRPGANPGHFSELLQRQARRTTMTAEHFAETHISSDGTSIGVSCWQALALRVAGFQGKRAEEEAAGGPQGDHPEPLPRGERQALYPDRGLGVQAGGQRTDLPQVP